LQEVPLPAKKGLERKGGDIPSRLIGARYGSPVCRVGLANNRRLKKAYWEWKA
jgi:hypothetical protein